MQFTYQNWHFDILLIITYSHWGRVTHICVTTPTSIGSDNGLSLDRRQATIRTNAGILLIGPLGTNFNEIVIEIHTFSFRKIHLSLSSAKWRLCCLDLNVLMVQLKISHHCFRLVIRTLGQQNYYQTIVDQHVWHHMVVSLGYNELKKITDFTFRQHIQWVEENDRFHILTTHPIVYFCRNDKFIRIFFMPYTQIPAPHRHGPLQHNIVHRTVMKT